MVEQVRSPKKWELLLLAAILLLATMLRAGWPTLTEFKFSEARQEQPWGQQDSVGYPRVPTEGRSHPHRI
jgi:hypothetical protein